MLLAIDSSAGASAAVVHEGHVLASWRTAETNTHAEVLASAVQRTLEEAGGRGPQLDGVVVGVGPGPFTGLRVGLALAHSLAEVWQKPLHGICSLDSLALRAAHHGIRGEFLAASDARRREVYWARYRVGQSSEERTAEEGSPRLIDGPHVSSADAAPAQAAVGAGVGLYPEQLHLPPGFPDDAAHWLPDAAELGLLAEPHAASSPADPQAAWALPGGMEDPQWADSATKRPHNGSGAIPDLVLREPLPLYLRESDAKVPQQMKRAEQ